jgi:hypothetical protein
VKRTPSPASSQKNSIDNKDTSLPAFKTWRGVYIFVFATFVAWVVLLALLQWFFS